MVESAPTVLPIRKALSAIAQEDIDGDAFLRAVMMHPSWLVSGRTDGENGRELGVLQTGRGRILEVYTDRAAVENMERVHGDELTGTMLEMQGFEVFQHVETARINRVNFNPGSEPKIHYEGEDQLALLAAWAVQVEAEIALLDPQRLSDPFDVLANYPNYHMVYDAIGAFNTVVLAPDSVGRALGAIFTSWNNAKAFADAMVDEDEPPLEVVPTAAKDAFELLQGLNLAAIVFNPLGALPPRALDAKVLAEILPRIGHTH